MYVSTRNKALPIPPIDVLERFSVHEPLDTRFRSCARLLQAIWRERRGWTMGSYARANREPMSLGSRLDSTAARAGFNYLNPAIAKLVRMEIAYREQGALIDEARAWENLLSSTALAFNLLAPLKLNPTLAKSIMKLLFSIDVKQVDGVFFETSPGRGNEAYTGDHTALDALIAYTGKDGKTGFVGIEVKYAESQPANATPVKARHMDMAGRSNLFIDATAPKLQQAPLRQFFAEHALCYSMVHERRLFDRGQFIVIAPNQNAEIASAVEAYRLHLSAEQAQVLPFGTVSVEDFASAIGKAGEAELAKQITERYLDFGPVHELIDDWTPHAILNAQPMAD